MVRLRMQRFGRRHRPFFRINAIDQRTRRNGKVIENLGHYDPMHPDEASQVVLKPEKIRVWLDKGAQPSETVRDLLATHDVLNETEKAAWEADRAKDRDRTACKQAAKAIEDIIAEIDAIEGDADTTAMSNAAKKALTAAKASVSAGDTKAAEAARAEAEKQRDAAKAAVPAPEPEAEAEGSEGESAVEASE
ncbi:MAG: 30S ribosomal protein S16 [Phycisphaerales bacterium JB040]